MGEKAVSDIGAKYKEKGYDVKVKYPKTGKDWNEYLQGIKKKRQIAR